MDRLLDAGHEVVGFDDFSSGRERNLVRALGNPRFTQVRGTLADRAALESAMEGVDVVHHLAANADVRSGPLHPGKDLEQNTVGTWHVLEAMRRTGARRIAFASTGSVYGESTVIPTPEDAPFPVQTSLYGASKLAGEGLVAAYCASYDFQGCIFRLVSVLGERYSHGHVIDFHRQLTAHPDRLDVLGDGHQRKSYLDVQDCVEGIVVVLEGATEPLTVVNLGTDEHCEVRDSVRWITGRLALDPRVTYQDRDRGWVGDNPFIHLDCSRARGFGWAPAWSIRESVERTVDHLVALDPGDRSSLGGTVRA